MTNEPEEVEPLPDVTDCDTWLQFFASMVHETATSISLTLSVNGSVVTGTLVGRDAWLEKYVQVHRRFGEDAGDFAAALRDLVNRAVEGRPKPTAENFGFLHLTEAQVVQGEAMIPVDADGLWRVRITRVDAWAPGRLATAD